MAQSLSSSITAKPAVRQKLDNGEISFAIDTEAGAYRDTLAGIYLSVLPAAISLIAGVIAVIFASSLLEGAILFLAIVFYALVSWKLIQSHQAAQAKFFNENMRSFGVLSNSLSLWKETTIFKTPAFLVKRYKDDRKSVELAGAKSYAATRNLYVAQALILSLTICLLIFSISFRTEAANAEVIGAIVATVGIAIAAIYPLQDIGFGISRIAVSIAQEREAQAKIRPTGSNLAEKAPWEKEISELRLLIEQNTAANHRRPIWILGESGSGKTTLLEGILGLNTDLGLTASSGTNADSGADTNEEVASYVQQTPGLLNASASENVAFGRSIDTTLADEILESLGLAAFNSTGERKDSDVSGEQGGVSGGERLRIAIARALVDPANNLVVLDEPTSGLDKENKAKVWELIEKAAEKKTVIVSTHDESAPILDSDEVLKPVISRG